MNGPGPAEAIRAARELHSATELLLDAVAARYGINRNDLHCLEILEREGPMNARRLARLAHLSPAAVTKVVDRLARAGYARRRPSSDDRRAQVIETTAEHGELRESVWHPVSDDATAALDGLPPTALRQFTGIARRLAEVTREHADRLA
ncbi:MULTISPECIES: MarR family winged helix-turn-helix transcriptional regulator [Prauserella]|nr:MULTISPECIES: MarR family transcriptional regulator [Prauserella]PXY37186.1 hypothetical protein BAY59_00970 [Prauserella coralliicola]